MEIELLLAKQRRVGDEFRIVEKAVQRIHQTLTERHLDVATRSQIEASAISTTTELMRLGQWRLELDALVSASTRGRSYAAALEGGGASENPELQ